MSEAFCPLCGTWQNAQADEAGVGFTVAACGHCGTPLILLEPPVDLDVREIDEGISDGAGSSPELVGFGASAQTAPYLPASATPNPASTAADQGAEEGLDLLAAVWDNPVLYGLTMPESVRDDIAPRPFGRDAERLAPFIASRPELERRVRRLREWALRNHVSVPRSWATALACCDSAAEVRFMLQMLRGDRWMLDGPRSFTDGRYRLSSQVEIAHYRVDALIEGHDLGRGVIVEIDGPQHYRPEGRRSDARRTRALERLGYRVQRVSAREAKEFAVSIRKRMDLDELIPRSGVARSVQTLPIHRVARSRTWPPNDWSLRLDNVPEEERSGIIAEWLPARYFSLPDERREEGLRLLSRFVRSEEIALVMPFVADPRWAFEPDGMRYGASRVRFAPTILGHRVSASREVTTEDGTWCEAILIDVPCRGSEATRIAMTVKALVRARRDVTVIRPVDARSTGVSLHRRWTP
jgi:very-short-patch-repair endonuclease